IRRQPVGQFWRTRHSIAIMAYREDAGVIDKPGVTKNIQGPTGLGGNGVTGRTIAQYRLSDDIFQQSFGLKGFFSKDFWRLGIDQLMTITMTRNFMTGLINTANQVGVSLCDPTQDKKSGFRRVLVE